jgi:hypothetical protein
VRPPEGSPATSPNTRPNQCPGLRKDSRQARSNGGMTVRRPDWWPHPERCANGHEWGPGRVLVVWQRCLCPGAQTLHEDRAIWGHFTVTCREPGCRAV